MLVRTHRFNLPSQETLSSVQREMENFFGHFLKDVPEKRGVTPGWRALVSVWNNADKVFVEVELPGVTKDSIDLTVHNGVLRISGERKCPEGDRNYWVNERLYGTFDRAISLPEDIDADSIEAEFADGVLRIELSKKPDAQPKKIAVKG